MRASAKDQLRAKAGRRLSSRRAQLDMIYTTATADILRAVSKHLVDIDEQALQAARAKLGTDTIKDTVNGALRRASGEHLSTTKKRLDALSQADLAGRELAWR
jgi:Arc/MetJ family transcription regulator